MKWFKEKEFACRCCGELPPLAQANVRALVENVLDPARDAFGKPITVNSGYRCAEHNLKVGGVRGSQHLRGEAADVCCDDNAKLAQIIREQGIFDQLIIYPTFIHVSYKRFGPNRHQVLKKVNSGYQPVSSFTTTRPSLPKEGTYQPQTPSFKGSGLTENRGDRRFTEFGYRSQSLCPNGRAMSSLSAGAEKGGAL